MNNSSNLPMQPPGPPQGPFRDYTGGFQQMPSPVGTVRIRPSGGINNPDRILALPKSTYTDSSNTGADLSSNFGDYHASCDSTGAATRYIYLFMPKTITVNSGFGGVLTLFTKNVKSLRGVSNNTTGFSWSTQFFSHWTVAAVTDLAGLTPATLNWSNQGTLTLDSSITSEYLVAHPAHTIAAGTSENVGFSGDNLDTNMELRWINTGLSAVDVVALRLGVTIDAIGGGESLNITSFTHAYLKLSASSQHDGSVVRGWVLLPPWELT